MDPRLWHPTLPQADLIHLTVFDFFLFFVSTKWQNGCYSPPWSWHSRLDIKPLWTMAKHTKVACSCCMCLKITWQLEIEQSRLNILLPMHNFQTIKLPSQKRLLLACVILIQNNIGILASALEFMLCRDSLCLIDKRKMVHLWRNLHAMKMIVYNLTETSN